METYAKGFKFRIYPNKTQQEQINRTLGCCRFVYNHLNKTVALESKAIKHIQNEIVMGHIELVSSYVLRFENENSPFLIKKLYIEDFIQKHSSFYVSIDRADDFLTTDKRVLKYQDDNLLLLNPLEFMTIYRERRK